MPRGREYVGHHDDALTDGLRLFRLVRGTSWPTEASHVVLEDCRTLEDRPYSIDELSAMRSSLVGSPGSRAVQ